MAIGHLSVEYLSAIFKIQRHHKYHHPPLPSITMVYLTVLAWRHQRCAPCLCTVPLVACVEQHFACVLLISKNTMTECHKCRKLVYFGEFSYLTIPLIAGFPKIFRFASKHEHQAQSTVAHRSSWTSFKLRSLKITVAELYPK